jgi:hypothetical protein
MMVSVVREKNTLGVYMGKMTKREKIVEGLVDKGYKEVPCRSGKYLQFTIPFKPDTFIFVGKKGAVRVGPCASKSYSVTSSKFVKILLTK